MLNEVIVSLFQAHKFMHPHCYSLL